MQQLSLCLTTFNRLEMTIESFGKVYSDDRIGEIIIVDDCSDIEIYNKLKAIFDMLPKVRLVRNEVNRDCYRNKMTAISLATSEYVVILDSDNSFDKRYIDAIYNQEWEVDTILAPDWAVPLFPYTDYSGLLVTKENVSEYIDRPLFETCLNCMNYFVNKNEYLRVWDGSIDPHTSDSLFQNYNWLKAGNKIHIVDGLRYNHLVHNDSHYRLNNHKTGNFREEIISKIRNFKNEFVV